MRNFIKKVPTSSIVLMILVVLFTSWGIYQFSLSKGSSIFTDAVVPEDGHYLSENEGKYVCISGKPVSQGKITDPLTGVTVEGLILRRNVYMYQYEIENDTVMKEYLPYQQENIEGDGGEKYENPEFPEDLDNAVIIGDAVVGEYRVNKRFLSELNSESFSDEDAYVFKGIKLPVFDNKYGLKPTTEGYKNQTKEKPQIGDIKIVYDYLPSENVEDITFFGIQKDGYIGTDSKNDICYMSGNSENPIETANLAFSEHAETAKGMLVIAAILAASSIIIYFSKNKKQNGGI